MRKRLRHVIAEGPEAGIYIRGTLKDNNQIKLPEYWDGLVDPETITVTLTQIGYSQDLIVEGVEWGKVVKIKSGNGANINCYYEIWEHVTLIPWTIAKNFMSYTRETVLRTIQVTMSIT